MAWRAACFTKLNLGVLSNKVIRPSIQNQVRTLFTKESLGILGYEQKKQIYKEKFHNLEDSFRSKMQSYVADEGQSMIFTEDLKVMVHILNKTPEDLELLVKMLKKFNSQSNSMRFGSFTFGPVVMRALYTLNEPDVALKVYNDPDMVQFFAQATTYQVLLDLLYCNKKYSEMRTIYESIKQRIPDGKVHPRNAVILVTAGCYKENTPESFQWAKNLWRELNERGYPNVRRVTTHFGALALRQGQPDVTLEVLTNAHNPRYIAIRCLKIMAYVDLDRLDDVVPYFRNVLETDLPNQRKETFFKDAIEKVEEAVERKNINPDNEIVKHLKLIRSGNYVQDMTMDDHINTEVTNVLPSQMQGASYNRSYRRSEETIGPKYLRNPGLRDRI